MPRVNRERTEEKGRRKPEWLRVRFPDVNEYAYLKKQLSDHGLHTICESGKCPNIGECWAAKTATFMILGDVCSRNCKFCAVTSGKPPQTDSDEPKRLAEVVHAMGIKHCVLTSVTRDDMEDGGAAIWAETVRSIKSKDPSVTIETLIPDFNGDIDCLKKIVESRPEIISHNLETVERLTEKVRSKATYVGSLDVLKKLRRLGAVTKSGIMLGLGETKEDIEQVLDDLIEIDCRIITIGQYLQPRRENIQVDRYVEPEEFEYWKNRALEKGFDFVESSPLVRSSYHAEKHVKKTD